ncbi:MAG TPA: hypothetical protein VHT73_12350 [Thermodesulfobacteriota bacterium]|nr:hypothetical protein [Thermodesulfobacteriota bacterium]
MNCFAAGAVSIPLLFGKRPTAKFGKLFSSFRMMLNPDQPDFDIAGHEQPTTNHHFEIKYQ